MIEFRFLGVTVAAVLVALAAGPARADNYNPYVTVDYLESAPRKNGDSDRPIVLGEVPNPAKPRREDKIWDWDKSQQLHDLPAPPPTFARPMPPSPHANGGVSKFSANIGSHLKRAPRRPNLAKRR